MKEKQLNAIVGEEIYQARLKKFERFKERMKGNGFRRIEVETYLIKSYSVLDR